MASSELSAAELFAEQAHWRTVAVRAADELLVLLGRAKSDLDAGEVPNASIAQIAARYESAVSVLHVLRQLRGTE